MLNGKVPGTAPNLYPGAFIRSPISFTAAKGPAATRLINRTQAFATSKGLAKFRLQSARARQPLTPAADSKTDHSLLALRRHLIDSLTREIGQLEIELKKEAAEDASIKLAATHSGIGNLTALALAHTLGDVHRFARKDQVVAFVGLDPLDQFSGEKHRIGKISKKGSRLLRFLLGQAAQTTRDKRLREFYWKVNRRRGKAQAKVACARKLLINCYIMFKDGIDCKEFCRRSGVGLCG